MNDFPKKTYTVEDNIKSVVFSLKEIQKQITESNRLTLEILTVLTEKKNDEKGLPF